MSSRQLRRISRPRLGSDYAASRGEYLNGIIMANYLGYEFIDAATVIFFDEEGNFDAEKTDKVMSKKLGEVEMLLLCQVSTVQCQMEVSRHFQEVDLI